MPQGFDVTEESRWCAVSVHVRTKSKSTVYCSLKDATLLVAIASRVESIGAGAVFSVGYGQTPNNSQRHCTATQSRCTEERVRWKAVHTTKKSMDRNVRDYTCLYNWKEDPASAQQSSFVPHVAVSTPGMHNCKRGIGEDAVVRLHSRGCCDHTCSYDRKEDTASAATVRIMDAATSGQKGLPVPQQLTKTPQRHKKRYAHRKLKPSGSTGPAISYTKMHHWQGMVGGKR